MDFLKSYDEYLLNEAIEMSVIRPYIQAWKDDGGEEKYKELFKNKWRIYLKLSPKKSDIYHQVEDIIEENGYYITDYYKNEAAKKGDKRPFKIGKLLNRFGAPDDLMKDFAIDRDKVSVDASKYTVVISRHPYDIIGMSTGREWSSCMSIPTKSNHHCGAARHILWNDIKYGTLVAYLVEKHDTNIKEPLNRIAIKPFVNEEGDTILATDYKVYFGESNKEIPGFMDTVEDWLRLNQSNSNTNTNTNSIYRIHKDLYPDGKTVAIDNSILRKLKRDYVNYEIGEDGYITVFKDKKTQGMADAKGSLLVPVEFKYVEHIKATFFKVEKKINGELLSGLYDSNKKILVIPFTKNFIGSFPVPEKNLFNVVNAIENTKYLVNADSGKKTDSFKVINLLGNTLVLGKETVEKMQIADLSLEHITEKYDLVYRYSIHHYIIKKNGKYGIYDIRTYSVVLPPIHDMGTIDEMSRNNKFK
jgi:hypothetical protein